MLFGIITAFVTTKSVKPSAAMLDAILRGGWVPAGTGTKKKMRRAGLRYSEALRLGRSPLEILLRAELSSAGVIMPSDGEGEFENWPCEGDRALDKAVSGSAIVHSSSGPRLAHVCCWLSAARQKTQDSYKNE